MADNTWITIYFVRHGETRWNYEGRWQGWQDSPLTETGHKQAADAAEQLASSRATRIFTSDAGRALQTATTIGERLGLKPQPVQELRERYYGEYEGLTSDEIDAKFPDTRYAEGRDRRDTWRPIGGETLIEVAARVMTFVRTAAAEYPGETIIAVTHAGVLRVIDGLSSRQMLDDIWERVPPNCGIFAVKANTDGDLAVVQHFCEF